MRVRTDESAVIPGITGPVNLVAIPCDERIPTAQFAPRARLPWLDAFRFVLLFVLVMPIAVILGALIAASGQLLLTNNAFDDYAEE